MSTVYILWLRQIKRYLRSRSRMIGSLGQPLLFLLAFGFGFGSIYKKAGGGDYIQFLAPGIISMSVLFTAIFAGIEMIWDRQFGFLKETMVAPVPRLHIMLGRTLGGATIATLQGLIVFVLTLLIGFRPAISMMLLLSLVYIFLIALLFTAMGTTIAARMQDMQGFQLIMNFLVMPIFFLSDALFPLENLPVVLDVITRLNPLSYGIDGLRASLTGVGVFNPVWNIVILGTVASVFLLLGAFLFERMEV